MLSLLPKYVFQNHKSPDGNVLNLIRFIESVPDHWCLVTKQFPFAKIIESL